MQNTQTFSIGYFPRATAFTLPLQSLFAPRSRQISDPELQTCRRDDRVESPFVGALVSRVLAAPVCAGHWLFAMRRTSAGSGVLAEAGGRVA